MVKDAQAHADEDKMKKEEVTARNETDQLIYQTENNLKDLDESMEPDDKAKVEAALERTKEAIKGTDTDEIISARDGLNAAWHEVASKIYSQTAQQTGQTGEEQTSQQQETAQNENSSSDKDSGAVDADYEVVD